VFLKRLVGLFYAYRTDPSLFKLIHGTLGPTALVTIVGLYALYWFQSAEPDAKQHEPAST